MPDRYVEVRHKPKDKALSNLFRAEE